MGKNASFSVTEPNSADEFRKLLRTLRCERHERKLKNSKPGKRRRNSLSLFQRARVLAKTGKRCHICAMRVDAECEADPVTRKMLAA